MREKEANMAIDISEMAKKTKTVTAEFQGDTLTISFRIHVVTPVFMAGLRGLTLNEILVKQVISVVEKWDLLKDGTVIPLTEAGVGEIPAALLTKILNMVQAEMDAPDGELKKS